MKIPLKFEEKCQSFLRIPCMTDHNSRFSSPCIFGTADPILLKCHFAQNDLLHALINSH